MNLPFTSGDQARGLQNFITDIRNCSSREAEQQRVDKELANIRQKFSNSSTLTSYQRKKYVWKLVYIFMLGYEVDFGHMEIIALISSGKFSEKSVGYVAVSLLMKSEHELMTLVVNSVRNDLVSHNNYFQSLALASIANIGGAEFAEALTPDVQRVLTARDTDAVVRKKAALCLLKLFRTNPDNITHADWAPQMAQLLEDRHLGVVLSTMSLLIALASKSPAEYEICVPYVVALLSRLVLSPRAVADEYLYYSTPSPWLQVRFLKFLQLYPPPGDSSQAERLNESLKRILTNTAVSETVNKSNADHAVLFEAVNVILAQGTQSNATLRTQAMALLGRFISVKEPNIRYLGLEAMSRFAQLQDADIEQIKRHQSTVLISLKDADISVRRQALDLLFAMCDHSNATTIVEELTTNLATADAAIRDEMVLKIAVLAERYATDLRWYVDTVLQLIHLAGDFVADDVWHRIIQMVTNHKDLQQYAATNVFKALEAKTVHETAVSVGGYVLGEFGYLIAEQPGMGGEAQFQVLHKHFPNVSHRTKALLLSTYAKLENLYPEVRPLIQPVFDKYSPSTELELQQRAVEYSALLNQGDDIMDAVLQEMPAWPEDKESTLEMRLKKKQEASEDRTFADAATPRSPVPSPTRVRTTKGSSMGEDAGAGDDLLDLGSGSGIPEEPADDDLLGGGLGLSKSGNKASQSAPVRIPEETRPKIEAAFKTLTTGSAGVLFENDVIQLGLKHEYRGSQGRMALFYGNKTGGELQSFKSTVADASFLRVQSQDPPESVGAGQQAKHQLLVEAMKPFDYKEAPGLTVSFVINGQPHLYDLTLPVVPSCFFEPVTMPAADYMARWKSLEGQSREKQEVLNQPPTFAFTPEAVAALKTKVLEGMHLAQAQGVDQTEMTLSVAGTFRTGATGPEGQKVSVGALMRIEINAQARAMRVTSRAVHGAVATALVNTIAAIVS